MMRWEYLGVLWWSEVESVWEAGESVWEYQNFVAIARPYSSEREIHQLPNTEVTLAVMDILNGLGREGWELVSSTVNRRAVGPTQGYNQASYPIERGYLFKRPITEDGPSS